MALLVMVLDSILGCINTNFLSQQTDVEEIRTDDEITVSILNCRGCSRIYSDGCVPRSLSCGHSLCTSCAEALYNDEEGLCPECLTKPPRSGVGPLPVNYQLLRLSRSLRNKKISISAGKMKLLPDDVPEFKLDQDLWKCSVHNSPKVLFCRSCNLWICEDCLVLDHPLPPRGSCRVLQDSDAIKQISDKYREVAANLAIDIEIMKRGFELEFGMHEFCLKYCTRERSHLRLVKSIEPLLQGKFEGNADEVKTTKERLKKLNDSFSHSVLSEDITALCRELFDFQDDVKEIICQEKKRLVSPRPFMLEHFRMEIKRLAEKEKNVYATLQEGERYRWSRVSLKEERLLLSALVEGKPPSNGLTVPYRYLEMLTEDEEISRTIIFLEVEAEGETLSGRTSGRIFVELDSDNPLTRQMLLMCSGKKGVSYRNTRFFQEKKGRISGGKYYQEDGTRGGTIVEGLEDLYVPCYFSIWNSQGILIGDKSSTTFHFILQNENEHFDNHIGYVKQGMGVLKAMANIEPVTKCFIKDCGIFIRMNRKVDDSSDSDTSDESDDEENDEDN